MSSTVLIKIEAEECVPVSFKVYMKEILLVFEKPFSLLLSRNYIFCQ